MKNEENKVQEKNNNPVKLFGFIIMLAGFGSSFAPSVGDIPLLGRIFFILFGLVLFLAPNKNLDEIKLFSIFFKKNKDKKVAENKQLIEEPYQCPNCGNKLSSQANFCKNCGKKKI